MRVTATDFGPPLMFPHLTNEKIFLRREAVADHRVWHGRFHLPGRTLLSDALVRAAEARKLRKLECEHLEEA